MAINKINSIGRIKDALVLILFVLAHTANASFLTSIYCKSLGKFLCRWFGKCSKCDETDAPSSIPTTAMPSSSMPSATPTSATPTMMPSSSSPSTSMRTSSPTPCLYACYAQFEALLAAGDPIPVVCGSGAYDGCGYVSDCVTDCIGINSSTYFYSEETIILNNTLVTLTQALEPLCGACPSQTLKEDCGAPPFLAFQTNDTACDEIGTLQVGVN